MEDKNKEYSELIEGIMDTLLKTVEVVARKVIKEELEENYERYIDAVVEQGGNTESMISVRIPGSEDSFYLANKTGELLASGDTVRAYVSGRNLSNGYIGKKR